MADEKEKIANEQEAVKPTSRQRLTDRYKKSRPDLNWEDETIDNDIEGLAADELESLEADKAKRDEMDAKMNSLFSGNPKAAKIFADWAGGLDPVENLIEMYGDDFVNALQSEEGKEKFKAALEKWRKGKEADAEHEKAYEANIAESARNLASFADERGLDDAKLKDIVEKAHQFGSDVLEGKYPVELLDLIYKAGNYDNAVAEAREEGRVNGKNENIRRELRQSKPVTNMPETTGSQANIGREGEEGKAKPKSISMFGGIPVAKRK